MKNNLIIALLLIVSITKLHAQEWRWQNPLPQGTDLNDLHFFNEQEGIAVGMLGLILRTADGGTTWEKVESTTKFSLKDVHFVNERKGWIVGSTGRVLLTNNSGRSWKALPIETNYDFRASTATNDGKICAVGEDGVILMIDIENLSWIPTVVSSKSLRAVQMVNDSTGFVVSSSGGGEIIQFSIEEGQIVDFAVKFIHPSNLYDIFFLNEQKGWAMGTNGALLQTTDGGATWTAVSLELEDASESLNHIRFTSETSGWIFGSKGTIWYSQDGGENWEKRITNLDQRTAFESSVFMLNDSRVWLIRNNIVYRTENPTEIWERLTTGATEELNDVFFSNDNQGCVIGRFGLIWRTTDGGTTWDTITTPTTQHLNKLFFYDDTLAWIVGENGTILHSQDGGINWQIQDAPVASNFLSVHFPTAQIGYIVGTQNTLLKTTNGGATWQKLAHDDDGAVALDVYFKNEQEGWALAGGGDLLLLKTTDGGQNWSLKTISSSPSNAARAKIHFVNEQAAWIVGTSGKLFKSTNGGNTWRSIDTRIGALYYDVHFLDEQRGWAVGTSIAKTENGGITWTQETTTNQFIRGIHFPSVEKGWMAGGSGNILHYQDTNYVTSDSLALVALYHSTDGANWLDPWDLTTPLEEWEGIELDENERVKRIYLQNRRLRGTLPPEIGNLTALTILSVSSDPNRADTSDVNILTGSIPKEIGQLQNLTFLNLSRNQLTGTIPEEIGTLYQLTNLSLDDNQLSGSIPASIGNLSELQTLSLVKNQLSGAIPAASGYLEELKRLSLSENQFTGEIPAELRQLRLLESLYLDQNELSGTLPDEIGELYNLKVLSLHSNNLKGEIPAVWGRLARLNLLYLNDNLLSGSLPYTLSNLLSLGTFYVQNNQLSGCYPSIFQPTLCQRLTRIDVSNNLDLADWQAFCEGQIGMCQNQERDTILCAGEQIASLDEGISEGFLQTEEEMTLVRVSYAFPVERRINETLCWGNSLQVGDQWYNCNTAQNTLIQDTILGQTIHGCDSLVLIQLQCQECEGSQLDEIPAAFSPNGDGYNDLFVLPNLIIDESKFGKTILQITNPYRQLVYESNRYQNDWDGNGLDGKPLPSGTYYYLVQYPSGENRQGIVTIAR